MSYSTDTVYLMVGRDDRVATLTLYSDSHPSKIYGEIITVLFEFNPFERAILENNYCNQTDEGKAAVLKVTYLAGDLNKEQIKALERDGINTSDIANIIHSNRFKLNTYHSKDIRTLQTMNIAMNVEPKGGDYDWIYRFTKDRLRRDIGLPPDEMNFYYACRVYYESDNITNDEREKIYTSNGVLKPEIELELIELKIQREDDQPQDIERFHKIYASLENGKKAMDLISKELLRAGTSLKKLALKDPEKLQQLYIKVCFHKDIHLNVMGKVPIYLNKKGLLHIYLKHVKEYSVYENSDEKDNFQWDEKDVIRVIKAVIMDVDDEAQRHWSKKPNSRFSKFGKQSYYFEGDYYTFHIEKDGSLSTFHTIKK